MLELLVAIAKGLVLNHDKKRSPSFRLPFLIAVIPVKAPLEGEWTYMF